MVEVSFLRSAERPVGSRIGPPVTGSSTVVGVSRQGGLDLARGLIDHMCGIFAFLAGRNRPYDLPGDALFEAVEALSRHPDPRSIGALDESERSTILRCLEVAEEAVYRWLSRGGFLAVARTGRFQDELRRAAGRLTRWVDGIESSIPGAEISGQRDWEFLNRLIVGGKDVAWQIERDILGNLAPVREILGDGAGAEDPRVLAHAWALNLTLRSIDRLEVRGRDSAGLAVYIRFPDAEAVDRFLGGPGPRREDFEQRSALPALTHGAIVRPARAPSTLLSIFKVAAEVGRMGDNVAVLRRAMAQDPLFQAALRAQDVEIQCLAHTRWASNGIISLPNCHPVDGSILADGAEGAGEVVAVLNGDVDNYVDLVQRHIRSRGLRIDPSITTDAKIIPVVVGAHYRETRDLREAFRRAFREFEGSMAIGVMAADRPGEFVFGQKGSGQGLFLGFLPGSVAVASEMYGLVEVTRRYVKAEGERVDGGEIFHLRAEEDGVKVDLAGGTGEREVPEARFRTAEITTRDINRGSSPHFFLKEIEESVESVRKTLRGKFEVSGGRVTFRLGPEVLGDELLRRIRSGKIRRVLCIGQGTAAIAAEGVAHLLDDALRGARPPLRAAAMKATELSGHFLTDDMSDTLIVAVSQSGTTTDTNRTVDMAKERGAWILGIVNRRNSDLVYKSHGVLYTSDGRDIEMSVASTKAFYAQNVAGAILALALAAELDALTPGELCAEVDDLVRLPDAMARTLLLGPRVAELAGRLAVVRKHWAIVGSGAGKIAADEIRIKLSELCYKSIAVDFLEDKKHIDLSSEPFILVCANGASPANISDLVKEVAIFKAHKSLPLVIADEGEDRFEPYAAGTVKVPAGAGRLGYLLATMVGHLFGYHAAVAVDAVADRLRAIRAAVVGSPILREPGEFPPDLTEAVLQVEETILSGRVDAALGAGAATRLHRALEVLVRRLPPDALGRGEPVEGVVAALSEAIAELSRPIDAIKHQAKTVTVGISRGESREAEGPVLRALREVGLQPEELSPEHLRFVAAFEPLVASVRGATVYDVDGLDPLGRPTEASRVRIVVKTGCAREIVSRNEEGGPLVGTKWGILREGEIYLGFGKTDGRRILILPVSGKGPRGTIVLLHLDLAARGRRETRLRALRAHPRRLRELRIAVTERNVAWGDELVDAVSNETLFLEPADQAAEKIVGSIP